MNEELLKAYLERLRAGFQLEGANLDFKGEWWKEDSEFIKDICSMANCHSGESYIVVGIDERGKVYNSPLPVDEASLQQKHRDKVDPKLSFSCGQITIEDKVVSVIRIPHSENRPHVIKNHKGVLNYIPIRLGSSTTIASKQDLDEMYKERGAVDKYNLKVEIVGGKVIWDNYAGYEGNCFEIRLKIDNFDSNVPDYITKVSLLEKTGDLWKGEYFKFENMGVGKELKVPAREILNEFLVYVSDSPPEGLRNRRSMPNIDKDSLILEVTTRSGNVFKQPIRPGWIEGI